STQGGGSGGQLSIFGNSGGTEAVGGDLMLGGSLNLSGDSDGDFSGDGGELDVGDSDLPVRGSITISAPINASSGTGGSGGDVSFFAVLDISQSGAIQVQGKGTDGSGGNATLEAHRALTLNDIDATGDVFFGGEIDATAWCALTLPLGGTLDSTDGGINTLASGGTMAIGGTLRAIDGSNAIKFLNTQPTITGQVTPAATVTQDAALNPCPGPSGVCGDGKVDPGEQCDDGNQVNGDGCDNNCTFPGCGNGVQAPRHQS